MIILEELCQTTGIDLPSYAEDCRSVTINDQIFECDPECIEFVTKPRSSVQDKLHRKIDRETPKQYIKQNTALAALHEWGRKINPVRKILRFVFFFTIKLFIEIGFSR